MFKASAQQAADFDFVRFRVLPPDAGSREVAGQFMQLHSERQALLARHMAIALDLNLQSRFRCHVPASK